MKHVPGVLALLALLLFAGARGVSTEPYGYDEADYMFAAAQGFAANYSDTPTLSIAEFLRLGLERSRSGSQRQALSELVRRANDMVFYRHWHGPFYHFFLIPVARMGWGEQSVRGAMLAIPALGLIAIYAGCLWLIPGWSGIAAALVSGALFATSYSVVRAGGLAPHQLFALLSVCFAVLLAKWTITGRPLHWYGAVAMAALAFCTLEIAFVMILTLAVCAFVERRRLEMSWRLVGRSLGLWLAIVLAVWPSAIYKLSFLKAYFFMAYLAVARTSPWGNEGFLETWRQRLVNSPVEWLFILVGLAMFFRARGKAAYPVPVYCGLMVLVTLRILTGAPRYSLPFQPALDLFAGIVLGPAVVNLRRGAAAGAIALCCVLFGFAAYRVQPPLRDPDPRPAAVLSTIREARLDGKRLLVPWGDLPMIHYYFPGTGLRGYYGERPVAADTEGFAADAVLNPGLPVRLDRF